MKHSSLNLNFHNKLSVEIIIGQSRYKPIIGILKKLYEYFMVMDDHKLEHHLKIYLTRFQPNLKGCNCLDDTYYIKENYIYSKYKHKIAKWSAEISGLELECSELNISGNIFSYLVFPYETIYQVILYKLNRSGLHFIHALGLTKKNQAHLLIGRSGIGKSFLGGKSVKRNFKLLGDDTVLVDEVGRVHCFPLPVGFRNFDESLKDYQVNLTSVDKLTLIAHKLIKIFTGGYINLLFKIPPSRLPQNLFDKSSILAKSFFAVGNGGFHIKNDNNVHDLIERVLINLKFECIILTKLINSYNYIFPNSTVKNYWRDEMDHWNNVFNQSNNFLFQVPKKLGNEEFEKFERHLEIN